MVQQAVEAVEEEGIVFIDEIDKICSKSVKCKAQQKTISVSFFADPFPFSFSYLSDLLKRRKYFAVKASLRGHALFPLTGFLVFRPGVG